MNEEISKLIVLQKVDFEIAGFDQQINDKQQTITDREKSISSKIENRRGKVWRSQTAKKLMPNLSQQEAELISEELKFYEKGTFCFRDSQSSACWQFS